MCAAFAICGNEVVLAWLHLTDELHSSPLRLMACFVLTFLKGAVGHGGHYHSQSPEAFFCHVPGLKVGSVWFCTGHTLLRPTKTVLGIQTLLDHTVFYRPARDKLPDHVTSGCHPIQPSRG